MVPPFSFEPSRTPIAPTNGFKNPTHVGCLPAFIASKEPTSAESQTAEDASAGVVEDSAEGVTEDDSGRTEETTDAEASTEKTASAEPSGE